MARRSLASRSSTLSSIHPLRRAPINTDSRFIYKYFCYKAHFRRYPASIQVPREVFLNTKRVFAVLCPLLIAASLTWVGKAQNPPAPTVDRVGFPEAYQTWNLLYVLDRPDNKQIRTVWGNDIAAAVADGGQANYPYGSVVVMETWAALKDAAGNAILDKEGRFQKDPA